MNRVVVKFGGSVLRHPDDISKILLALKKYNSNTIIVVSAFYGCTDFLLKSIQTDLSDSIITKIIDTLYKRTVSFYSPYVTNCRVHNKALLKLLKSLKDCLGLIKLHGNRTEYNNYVASFGERLSSFALSLVLKNQGFDAVEALPEKFGLITDGQPDNAKINIPLSKRNIQKNIKPDKIYIIPGFYGISKTESITLLGRGGSDYSAAALAVCVNAKTLDLWKDVEGIHCIDPAIIPNNFQIPTMTYSEAEELSAFGAKIIHPSLIAPLAKRQIPIRLFGINRVKNNMNGGTFITGGRQNNNRRMFGISTSNDFGIVSLSGNSLGNNPNFIGKVLNIIKSEKVNIKSMTTSCSNINLLLEISSCKRVAENLKRRLIYRHVNIGVSKNFSVIAIVVDKLFKKNNWTGSIIGALESIKISPQFCVLDDNSNLSYVVVNKDDCNKVIKAIYNYLKTDLSQLDNRRKVRINRKIENVIQLN